MTSLRPMMTKSQRTLVFVSRMLTVRHPRTAALTLAAQTHQSASTVVSSKKMFVSLVLSACHDAVCKISALTSSTAIRSAKATLNAKMKPYHAVLRAIAQTRSFAKATKVLETLAHSLMSAVVIFVTLMAISAGQSLTQSLWKRIRTFGSCAFWPVSL